MIRRAAILAGIATLLTAWACSSSAPDLTKVAVIETKGLTIDRIYTSMAGPSERLVVDVPDMDWITAFRTEVIEAATGSPMGEEFFCHSQLQFTGDHRPVVAATGMSEIRFPEGFGMPIWQSAEFHEALTVEQGLAPEPLTFLGMVLNNHEEDLSVDVVIRATLEYMTKEDVGSPPKLKSLYSFQVPMTVQDIAEYEPPEQNPDVTTHCAVVRGQVHHWIVPPGPQKTRKRFPGTDVGVDSTVHLGVVHMHNYGRYMRLTDVTTAEILWQTDVAYETERDQIAKIPMYSSTEGFVLRTDHEYEIEAYYDNTTDHDVDAMAMMYLYVNPSVDTFQIWKDGRSG